MSNDCTNCTKFWQLEPPRFRPGRFSLSPGYNSGMDEPEPPRQRWFDLRGGLLLAFVMFVAAFVAWKWSQSANRDRIIGDFRAGGVLGCGCSFTEEWSIEWPFYEVETVAEIELLDGLFSDDDVRLLRRTFPGVPIYHVAPSEAWDGLVHSANPVKLPAD